MVLSAAKCSVIRITSGRRKKIFQSIYKLQVIEVVDGSKYLWMKVTEDMPWISHIAEVASKGGRGGGRHNIMLLTP